ncbi:MAG: serine/threonine protein kinase [Deltaproteobacteria bacterium]|nr:serine/threonine protein kinase [Deltaproteobacteria bacterium]
MTAQVAGTRESWGGEVAELGPYRLLEPIGEGGMGAVWRGERLAEGGFKKRVAIKRMLPRYRADRNLVQRFLSEARTTARLEHPNVVQVVDFSAEPEPYLVLEYVEGVSLATLLMRLLSQNEQLPPVTAAYIAAEAATGLDYAHRKLDDNNEPLGIIHRDVSPQNVLLSKDGAIKLSDFGIAKVADSSLRTQSGITVGKAGYMSPEQLNGLDIDARVDVFALGIVLWEMLTMRPLMPRDDPSKALLMITSGMFPPPSQLNPTVTPELDAIVLRALAVDRDQRTPSAGALASELRSWVHEAAPGYGELDIARLLTRSFPERSWIVEAPGVLPARPRPSVAGAAPRPSLDHGQRRKSQRAPDPKGSRLAWVLVGVLVVLLLAAFAIIVAMALGLDRFRLSDATATASVPPVTPVTTQPTLTPSTAEPRARLATVPISGVVYRNGQYHGTTPVDIGMDVFAPGPVLILASSHLPRILSPVELTSVLTAGGRELLVTLEPTTELLGVVYVRADEPQQYVRDLRTGQRTLLPTYVTFRVDSQGAPAQDAVEVVKQDGTLLGRLSLNNCRMWSVCAVGPIVLDNVLVPLPSSTHRVAEPVSPRSGTNRR